MTAAGHQHRAVTDPVGLIVDLVAAVEHQLPPDKLRNVVEAVAGGRAKSRRLAAALADRPAVLRDGLSPAPRAIGDLLIALRKAGAESVSAPCCAECGKPLRTFQRRGQDWYCSVCGVILEPCAACGNERRISSRDRAGHPRCSQCPDEDGRDPIAVIHTVVAALDPAADTDVIAAAVRRSAPRPSYQQKLAWALEANPELLTGSGHLSPFPAVLRLINLLHAARITGIELPACPRCHRVVRISKPLEGQRTCRNCIAKSRAEECFRCGARRDPATRDEQGRPLCPNCLITDPANLETCIDCGERRRVSTRTVKGPLCPNCRPLPVLVCSICGRSAPGTLSRLTGQPRCGACDQRSARCSACGRLRRIHSGTLGDPLCGPCTDPNAELWRPCPTCGTAERLRAAGPCRRCVLRQRLDELLSDSSGAPRPGLHALHEALAATERTETAMSWLSDGIVSTVLADLGADRRPLTHQALDDLPVGKTVEHLRSVLVAAKALPARDEQMARLERLVHDFVAARTDPDERQILHRYAVWHLLRRLRRRTGGKDATHEQLVVVRQQVRAATNLLDWLTEQDLTLGTCRQADLERWLTGDQASLRQEAGHFVRWAISNKVAHGLNFRAVKWVGPTRALDDEGRWTSARRLLHDSTLKTEDRLAGLLLLLYAQWPATISRLTVDHIQETDGQVRIRLGDAPVALPEPLAGIALQQVAIRRSHAAIAQTDSTWLFPGGQPGRPVSGYLMGERLRNLGIRPGQARSTALFQLATELPAAILARTLGIHIQVAVQWQRASAGDWATYAADVSRRTNHPTRTDT